MANYEIVKKIAVIGGKPDGVTKEINIVKWGVYDPAIDIRRWQGDICLQDEAGRYQTSGCNFVPTWDEVIKK